jgi:hypothetical protein
MKTDEVTEKLRELHNEELRGSYSSPSIIRMRAGHIARMGSGKTRMWKGRRKETPRKTKSWVGE